MDLYIIRHAEAEALGENGIQNDEDRPLTDAGHSHCAKLAVALQRQGIKLEQIITSPLLRAQQTAEDLLKKLSSSPPQLQTCDHLAPGGKRRKLTRYLRGLRAQSLAIVGHNPDLNRYTAWLIGSKKGQLDLAKAGIACIHFDDAPHAGEGVLTWMVTPEWC
jgi:phosphohistidine phosphatase